VEHRARAGGLHEPTDQRDQRDSHPHPSGRQPVAPLLSYGPSVVRRRRDVTAGAPSSGSRVILCPLHHVTPADGAPRVASTACSSQTIGCQTAASVSSARLAPTVSCRSFIVLRRWVKRERPTWLMAQAGRVEPLRSGDRVDALWRVPPEPGPCTTVSCIERSVTEPARPAARHFTLLLLSVSRLLRSHTAIGGDVHRRLRTSSHRADGRAPARGEPVLAGVPWACDGAMRERGHEIRQYGRIVMELQRHSRKRKIAPPMIARRIPVGVGPTHTPVAWCIDS